MSLKILKVIFTGLLISLFVSCYGSWNFFYEGNDVDKRTEKLKKISDANDEVFAASGISSLNGKYTVLVFTDSHFGSKKKDINPAPLFKYLNKLRGSPDYPVFALSLGDDVDIGTQDDYDLYNAFCEKLINQYDIKLIFNTCGNHDIYQGHWDNWKKNCYPHTSFYKFKTSNFSWYSLDTASGTIGMNQYELLSRELKKDKSPKIVFTHYRFVRFNMDTANMAETTERNLLISDFYENNVKCIVGGHHHTRTLDDLGFMAYGLASFGYNDEWGLLHVDEDRGVVELEYIN